MDSETPNSSKETLHRLSVVIPSYNDGRFIRDAIASVEVLPRELYEIIIVNDGSPEEFTLKVIADLEDAGYHIIHQANKGLGGARNAGVAAAKGEYILPLDTDNKIRADFIMRALQILDERPDISMVHGDFQYFGETNTLARIPPFDIKKMLRRNYIDACAVYRRSMWEACGGYDEQLPVMGLEDWDLWLNAYTKGFKFLHLDMIAFDYAHRLDSMFSNLRKEENWRASEEYIYKKYVSLLKEHYHDYERWDYHGGELRRRPIRTLFRLFTNAYYKRLHNRIYRVF